MAFGIDRQMLLQWKKQVADEEIAFLTHYWLDDRFPTCSTVTKVGCSNIDKLIQWGKQYDLKAEWIDYKEQYPHFDLFGQRAEWILKQEGQIEQLHRLTKQ